MRPDKCCNACAPTFWGCPVRFIATSSHMTGLDAMPRASRALLWLRYKDGCPFVVAAKQDSSPIMGWTYLLGVSAEEPDVDRRAARAFPAYLSGKKEDSAVVALPACKRCPERPCWHESNFLGSRERPQAGSKHAHGGWAVKLLDVPDRERITQTEFAMKKKQTTWCRQFTSPKSWTLCWAGRGCPQFFRK